MLELAAALFGVAIGSALFSANAKIRRLERRIVELSEQNQRLRRDTAVGTPRLMREMG